MVRHFSSERQAKRITDVTKRALKGIQCRLDNGEELRDDGFFTRIVDKLYAEETFESVLLKARDEPEQEKIQYLA